MRIRYIILLLLLGAAIVIVYMPRDLVTPKIETLRSFPSHIGQWAAVRDTMFDEPVLRVLRPTDYLMRTYTGAKGGQLSMYIGYHDGGLSSGPIHSPRNCLPGAGWRLENSKEIPLKIQNDTITVVRADFSREGMEITCYYWYQIRGKIITKDMAMKLAEFTGVLLENRKDAAFIRIDMLNGSFEKDDSLIQDFLGNAFPLLKSHLPS